jgi:hypothetical protein
MADKHSFLLRIPPDLWEELQQAKWSERRDWTQIILEGLVVRLRAIPADRLDSLLERIGYEPGKRLQGRPRKSGESPLAENVQVRDETEGQGISVVPDGDPWALDPEPEMSTIQSSNV